MKVIIDVKWPCKKLDKFKIYSKSDHEDDDEDVRRETIAQTMKVKKESRKNRYKIMNFLTSCIF